VIQVVILCKAPVPGKVKTRLLAQFSPEQAAEIHAAMVKTTIGKVARIFPDACLAADEPGHPFFSGLGLKIIGQGEGDLGDRLSHLLLRLFRRGCDGILFLGTDSPHMPESRLRGAAEALRTVDLVIGPVEDGGYDLIGLKEMCPDVFADIDWGSDRVLTQTLERAKASGLKVLCLDTGFDIDVPADLKRACQAGWLEAEQWLPGAIRKS
jgi:hypothetical protein